MLNSQWCHDLFSSFLLLYVWHADIVGQRYYNAIITMIDGSNLLWQDILVIDICITFTMFNTGSLQSMDSIKLEYILYAKSNMARRLHLTTIRSQRFVYCFCWLTLLSYGVFVVQWSWPFNSCRVKRSTKPLFVCVVAKSVEGAISIWLERELFKR